jgi:hypothetical protein
MLEDKKSFWDSDDGVGIIKNGRVTLTSNNFATGDDDNFHSRVDLKDETFNYGSFQVYGEQLLKKA